MIPRPGQRIGPYEILGHLGSGGMGLVFSAWDSRLQRDVAIKLLRDEYCTPDMRSRFLQEARAASGLNHPNICTIFDIGEQGGDPFLVMELLKGETLRSRIATDTLTTEHILQVSTETADALTVAHARGIIHRDIKPANIMLVDKPGGRFSTKVLDFGLAKVDVGEALDPRADLTSAGATVGTISYMSPEQARGETLDPRSDLFSLGVVMYEMCTGQVPFRGATSALVFVHLLGHAPEPVRDLNGAIPKKLERVITKLLAKDRSQRFQSASELVDALHEIDAKSAGKSLWSAIPSLMRPRGSQPSGVRSDQEAPLSTVNQPFARGTIPTRKTDPPAAKPQTARLVGEHVLRPVHRVASGHPVAPAGARSTTFSESSAPAIQPADSRPGVSAAEAQASKSSASIPSAPPSPGFTDSRATPRIPRPLPIPPQRTLQFVDEKGNAAPGFATQWGAAPQDVPPTEQASPPRSSRKTTILALWALAIAILILAALAVWRWHTRPNAAFANQPRTLVLASLANRTGDDALGGVLIAGLQIDLQQSPHLVIHDEDALASSVRALDLPSGQLPTTADANRAAQAIGATDMLFGELRNTAGAYIVSLRLYKVGTGLKTLDVTQTAASREQLPDAIDRAAADVRAGLGETGDQIAKSSVPLTREGSSNLEALAAFVSGQRLLRTGHFLDAMHAWEAATTADPHFTEAYLHLADLYSRQPAGLAPAAAAAQAQNSAQGASERTRLLAQYSYALNGDGDLPQAASILQHLLADYPADTEAAVQAATVLRLQGKFTESLDLSQRILSSNPYDMDAAWAAETTLLALDRPDAAAAIEARVQHSGHSHPGLRLLINYLGTRDDGQLGVNLSAEVDHLNPRQFQAEVLDAGGLLQGGLQVWREIAGQASANPELMSAAAEALSSAALNRALLNDCATANSLIRDAAGYPEAADSLFNSGLSAALCGDLATARTDAALLQQKFPSSFAAKNLFAPSLAATLQWKESNTSGALQTLDAARDDDRLSLAPYLRGLIHLAAAQPQAALIDFQSLTEHRGATTLTNPLLYPIAQLGVARAYAASGDRTNAAAAYKKFLVLWSAADQDQELVREARVVSESAPATTP